IDPCDFWIRDATPSFPFARIAFPGQLTRVAGPNRLRHRSLIAARLFVKAKVVPLPSCRTAVTIVRFGSLRPGLDLAISGSFQFLISPRKIPAYAWRESLRSPWKLGRL